jgi:hypothetical protein
MYCNDEKICIIKLVFATIALGMESYLRNVKRVDHAGPPSTTEGKIFLYILYMSLVI